MSPPAADQNKDHAAFSPSDPSDNFTFYRPQYHNGLQNCAERLNERRIRMAILAHGDGPDSIVRQSPSRLRELLRASQVQVDATGMLEGMRDGIYGKHEELESVAELILFRETYFDKLLMYSQQKVQPNHEVPVTGSSLVDLNNKP